VVVVVLVLEVVLVVGVMDGFGGALSTVTVT
jgi:hypothetical protein